MEISHGETATMDEATEKYPRQWLVVKVVDRDKESGQPLKVKILFNGLDLNSVTSNIGLDDYCTIYTGPIPGPKRILML